MAMRMPRNKSLAMSSWILGAALALSACETVPTVRVDSAPGANLAQYHTYDYFDKLATDKRGYTTITTRYIEDAVDREMHARGYTRGPNPDLMINLNIATRDRVESTPGPAYGFGFGGWRHGFGYGGWGGFGGGYEVETVTEGTLTVDLVDHSKNALVWTGSAVRVLNARVMDQPQASLNQAVHLIFAKFPIAGGPVAATM
jgi:Domain of unknown function (DUF4136)